MKNNKLFVCIFVFCFALLLGGCGKEKMLNCKTTTSGVDVGFNVKFTGNRIDDIDITYDMDLSSYSDIHIQAVGKQDFCKVIKSSMPQYKEAFEDCKQDITNKKLHVSAELDIDKIAKNELQKFSSVKSAKSGLEKVGYTCEIN